MTVDLSFMSLLILLVLLTPLALISSKLELELIKPAGISIIRMFIQLNLVGIYLQYIFNLNNNFINFAYVLLMISVASFSALESLNLKLRKNYILIFSSLFVPVIFLVMIFSIFVLKPKPILDAKYFIPITGMILGNSLKSTIMSLNNFFNIFEKSKNEYIYSIGLGATRFEALKNYIKSSITAVLKPAIVDMATLGIVALPGMMTGQILGGSSPMKAVKYQIAIMILIFAAKIYNSFLLMYLSSRFFFDDYDMPINSIFKKK